MADFLATHENITEQLDLDHFFSHQLTDIKDSNAYFLCITSYNETLSIISKTLDSISLNVASENLDQDNSRVVAFIIVDGEASADSELIDIAHGISVERKYDDAVAELSYYKTNYNESFGDGADFEIVLVVKSENRGKLNSHSIFFKEICQRLNPSICMQADAGTILTEQVLGGLKDTLNHDSQGNVGVGAGMCIEPREKGGLLHAFQSGEFLVQRGIYWAAELFFGYLSVMPGQCSAVRWSALVEKDSDNTTPLEGYLRSDEDFSAVDKLAYLAEDRVMGLELFSNAGYKNQITYAPKAVAYTDSCDTFTELLKQRRRWINSAFTCRVLMILFFAKQLFQENFSRGKKLKILSYLLYATALCCTEILLPAIFIGITLNTYNFIGAIAPTEFAALSQTLYLATNCIIFVPLIIAAIGKSEWVSKAYFNINMGMAITIFLVNLVVFYISSISNLLELSSIGDIGLAILFLVTSVSFPLIFLNAAITTSDLDHLPPQQKMAHLASYLGMSIFTYITLYVYAILNIKDTSWGTKGLDTDTFIRSSKKDACSKLNTYQYLFLLFYVGINTLFVTLSITTLFSMALFICIFVVGLHQWSKLNFEYRANVYEPC